MSLRSSLGIALICAATSACATTQALHVESSVAAIRSAEEHGATTVPQASLHLLFAKEALAQATALNTAGDKERAESWLLRAEADAELAVALSRAASERADAEAAVMRVRELRAENPYASGGAK